MILYINCCVRKDSRTKNLADHLIKKLNDKTAELRICEEDISPLSEEALSERTDLIMREDYSDKMFDYAKQFAEADTIVIAAPYWDLSFPSALKVYIENIFVSGITFRYTEEGMPQGLCKAKKLYYVTTAGGPYIPDFSYGYIKSAAENMLGIKETVLIKAEMLDIIGNNPDYIIEKAKEEIDKIM